MSDMTKVAKNLKKALNDSDKRKPKAYDTEAEVVGSKEDSLWVKFPGGETATPIRKTMDAKPGDKIMVRVSGHRAWAVGNETSPPTDDTRANAVAIAAQPSIDFVQELIDKDVTVRSISAATGYIDDLHSKNITTENIQATTGYIEDLTSKNITAQNIIADHETVESLDANYAHISNGVIDNAKIGYADVDDLDANYAHISNGVIDNAKIGYADVDDLDAHYAEIDLANVNNAWIEHGAMKKAEVFDENVFDLSGDHATIRRIDASKINVANLRADNLVVRRINGQPVVGGYTLIDSNSSGYSSKNPQALGWYEFVNAQWVLSQDTTVDMTKAYYQTGNEVSLYDQAYIDGLEDDLQQQIDGAIETFTGSVVPTLTNYPYTDWYDTSVTPVHDERAKHVGDIYYVVNSAADENGYCYRFAYDNTSHAYSWVLIKDSDVTKALSDISDLQEFESTTTSWIDETDEGLETIRTNHTTLAGVVDKTVKESIQLWFTKANTTAPNKPTAEVTSTSTSGNGWRKVVPAYNASYPNYYYCWQYKFVDGTFGWSDVVRDIAMGETQGTSRDAKNKADAALPASTFTSFESTTFKDVKDTVTEHSTTFTNMTSRLGMNSDGTEASTDIVNRESALEHTVGDISTRVGKTEMHLAGMYATSSTAAGTAAKVATIVPTLSDYELAKGAMVTVKFTAANTAASPTLNLNSTGAKAIKTYSGGNLTEAEYKWKAGSTFTFTYNGTNWLMQDSSVSVRMNSNETQINQTADSIESLALGNTTYTNPDGTTVTSAIGTTVSQTANNVLIKATRTGATTAEQQAGGTSAAALINVAPDTVKIAANHVEIDGTATFNAIKSSADATYDSKGSASAVQTNLDNLEIGGRNLVTGTSDEWFTQTIVDGTNKGINLFGFDSVGHGWLNIPNISGVKAGDLIQVSFDIKFSSDWTATGTGTKRSHVQGYANGKSGSWAGLSYTSAGAGGNKQSELETIMASSSKEGHINTWFVVEEGVLDGTYSGLAMSNIRFDYYSGTVSIRRVKVEIGNKATDWTPAPEDVQAEIDAKKSVHTISSAYLSSGASYATILGYAAEGTSTTFTVLDYSSQNIKIGDSVRLAYAVSNMNKAIVYINGTVTATPSSTSITITGHGLDTTIIDGGNILTNSIGANQIAANSITANKIAIGDFNNYVTVTEKDANSILTSGDTIENGWLKTNAGYSAQCPRQPRWTTNGESYRITGTVKAPSDGLFVFVMYARNSNGSVVNNTANYRCVLSANTETTINTVITLNNAGYSTAELSDILVCFCTTTTWTENFQSGYIKNLKCERMSGGNLIVDGSITADKIAIGTNHELENILLDSDAPDLTKIKAANHRYWSNGSNTAITCSNFTLTDAPEEGWKYGRRFVYDGSVATNNYSRGYCFYSNGTTNDIPLTPNITYTVSWWARCTSGSGRTCFTVSKGDGATGTVTSSTWTLTRYWKKYTYSFTFGSTLNTDFNRVWFYALFPTSTAGTVEICGCKLTAGADAESYITRIDDAGIRIHPSNTENHSVVINASGMEVFKGGITDQYSVAKYGDTVRIGAKSDTHLLLGNNSIQGINSNGSNVLDINLSDVQLNIWTRAELGYSQAIAYNASKTFTISEITQHVSTGNNFRLSIERSGNRIGYVVTFTYGTSKTVSNTDDTISYNGTTGVTITNKVNASITFSITSLAYLYSQYAPYWTFGGRSDSANGGFSFAQGFDNEASGNYSHAEGYGNTGSGKYSHCEGSWNSATKDAAHAEGSNNEATGNYSHAEGYHCKSTGTGGHAEGHFSIAIGSYSHAQNQYAVATESYQTAIGKYNAATRSGSSGNYTYSGAGAYAFIIGNGTGDATADRSNALAVDWNGNLRLKGDVYMKCNNNSSGGSKIADFVIEQSTSGNWRWHKWSSGIVEAWYLGQNVTYSGTNTAIALPHTLKKILCLTGNGVLNGSAFTPLTNLWCSTTNVYISFNATGTKLDNLSLYAVYTV